MIAPTTTASRPAALAGTAWLALTAGIAAWIWLADWRYAATGALLFILLAGIAGRRNR